MALLLHLETATETCSVALSENGVLLGYKEVTEPKVHATLLNDFIVDTISNAGKQFNQIDAVAVSKGPGSYTGLRIGVASAKGICFALNKPLISVNTLESFANFFINHSSFDLTLQSYEANDKPDKLFCPMLDARRMEVYTAIFDQHLNSLSETKALVIDENSFADLLMHKEIHFFGSGSAKAAGILKHLPNAIFHTDAILSARGMISIATNKFNNNQFEDLAYFEPYYLKEFVTTVSKKQL